MRRRATPAAEARQRNVQETADTPAELDACHDYVIPTGQCKLPWQELMSKAVNACRRITCMSHTGALTSCRLCCPSHDEAAAGVPSDMTHVVCLLQHRGPAS